MDPMPDLTLGRSIDLAVYGPAHDDPVLAQATVAADDGRQGVVLRFQMLAPRERERLEEIMQAMLQRIEDVINEVLKQARVSPADIDIVIRTGGSSQIAAVKRLLERHFPGKVTEHDPFTSVAAGLAIASYHGYKFEVSRGEK